MNRYLFVINPIAGGNDQTDLLEEITDRYGSMQNYEFYHTTGENDIKLIEERIERFQPTICVISGGDGTINMLIPTLIKYDLTMGIIPSGSANGLATELDIIMDNALDVVSNHQLRSLDIIKLNDQYMLHLADFGLNASLVKRYEAEDRHGFIGYAISAIQEFPLKEKPFTATIIFDDKEQVFSTKFLVIANAKSYGTGFTINPSGRSDDGLVEICVLKELSGQFLLNQILTDDPSDKNKEYFECFSVKNAIIKCSPATDFQSDGEYLGKLDEVRVEVLAHQLKVLVEPEKKHAEASQ